MEIMNKKIFLISQFYYPEPFRFHEICEELVRREHDVTVVTGRPNYPDGDLIDGNPNHQVLNDVEIIRTLITLRGHNPIS